MKEQLVIPADYPEELLRSRAVEHLTQRLDSDVMTKTGLPIRLAGLQIGGLLVIGYGDVVLGGFSSGALRDGLTMIQVLLMSGIAGCLGYAYVHGKRLQKQHSFQLQGIENGSIGALGILGARRQDIQLDEAPAMDPNTLLAEQRANAYKSQQAAKQAQAKLDVDAVQANEAPALADSVVSPPPGQNRRISL